MAGKFSLRACVAVLGASSVVIAVGAAHAWTEDVINHCTGDYLSYCKQHSPESAEVRYCMEAHRNQLSKQCIKALLDSGEVPKKYLANVPQSQQKK